MASMLLSAIYFYFYFFFCGNKIKVNSLAAITE